MRVSAMSIKDDTGNDEVVERRKHWRDRRTGSDRRNPQRLRLVNYDCRSGQPRREADVAGKLNEGDVWWAKGGTRYE